MRRALLVILAVAVAGGLLAATAGARTETRFTVVEISKSHQTVGSHTVISRSTLWSPVTGARVGRDVVKTTFKGRSHGKIHAIAFFRGEGTLKVQGTFSGPPNRNNSRFPIIGGTGAFNGAAGKLKVHTINHSRNLLHFAFVQ